MSTDDDFVYEQGGMYESTETLQRKIAIDLFPPDHFEASWRAFGLTGRSPEVAIAERAKSNHRKGHINAVLPHVSWFSGMAFDVIGKAILDVRGPALAPELRGLMATSTYVVIANLVELGLLTLPSDQNGPS